MWGVHEGAGGEQPRRRTMRRRRKRERGAGREEAYWHLINISEDTNADCDVMTCTAWRRKGRRGKGGGPLVLHQHLMGIRNTVLTVTP